MTNTEKKQNNPFTRVDVSKVVYSNEGVKNNLYLAHDGGYAQKAHEDLIVTRGKGFTKEKNKKKRGSFRGGGPITMGVNSFKFD